MHVALILQSHADPARQHNYYTIHDVIHISQYIHRDYVARPMDQGRYSAPIQSRKFLSVQIPKSNAIFGRETDASMTQLDAKDMFQ